MPRRRRPDLGHRSQSNVRRRTSRANRSDDQRQTDNKKSRIGMKELRSREDHHVADDVTNNPAEDSESDLDVSSDIVVKKEIEEKDKRNITTCSDEAYSNALATGVNVIITRVYKFFKREYEYLNKNYGEVFDITSFSNYEVRTAEATGFEIDVISRALEELEIQDGRPKKRKIEEENDSKLCVYTHNVERHNATDLNVSIALGPGDKCQTPKQPNLNYTPDVYDPPPGISGVASLPEGFVIYEMQSKPTEELCIKVENVENYEEMQEMNRISEDSKDPLKMQADYIENAESQVPKAVVRNPLGIETVNFQSTEHIPDGGVLIKEELDIVDEDFV